MINLLVYLLIIIVLELIIGFAFFKVFGNPITRRVMTGIFGISLCITLIPLLYFEVFSHNPNMLKDSWREVLPVTQQNKSFEFIKDEGLYANTIDSRPRHKISGPVPECAPSGKITRLNPDRIEITDEPIVPLPAFPSDVRDQITFNMYYSAKPGVFASSSFVMNKSKGYLWCVENSVGMGFNLSHLRLSLYILSYYLFIGCLILFSIIFFILLLIDKHKQRKSSQRIST